MTLTPWEQRGHVWLKRDDLYEFAGVRGGKVRTCLRLAEQGLTRGCKGLVTAGSRSSPQVNIVARVGYELGLPVRAYVPGGPPSQELRLAEAAGAELVPVKPGHNSVIRARARDWARSQGWAHVPFGMECREAVEETASQVEGLPGFVERLVVPVGSGMSLAGILEGLERAANPLPVLGVCVGAWPEQRLDLWAPSMWRFVCELVKPALAYSEAAPSCEFEGVRLDPIYEAKALPYLQPGDGLWLVGIRESEAREEVIPANDSFGAWMRALPRVP